MSADRLYGLIGRATATGTRTPLKAKANSWLRAVVLIAALAGAMHGAGAKSSGRPRVYVDASLVKDLVVAPVPNYPTEALKKGWGGLGVFEVQFRPDGTVSNALTLLTTEHPLLDETALADLRKWRCKPHAQRSARLTMTFSSHYRPVRLEPDSEEIVRNIPVHPAPTYPLEARRKRHVGRGLFVMRFRGDGSMKQVVALKSTGHEEIDQECIRTLMRWRCLPDVYITALVPITFSLVR